VRDVAGVNRFNLDAALAGHLPDLGEQRREGPSVHNQSLFPGALDSRADAFRSSMAIGPGAGSRQTHDRRNEQAITPAFCAATFAIEDLKGIRTRIKCARKTAIDYARCPSRLCRPRSGSGQQAGIKVNRLTPQYVAHLPMWPRGQGQSNYPMHFSMCCLWLFA